ncbi:MAG TPA: response regulator [Allosphingosinicella sp.]|nr:response regulator [Allosphingosinicella sp.]
MSASIPIMLVEDDPIVLDATAALLSDGGCDVRRASTAAEAMEALLAGPLPAVLVTDISLADDRGGLDLARAVAERWPEVRLLIVSGAHRPPPEDYPEGALFFTKPYASGALLAMVKGADW